MTSAVSETSAVELGDVDSDEALQLWSFGNDFDDEEWTW